jgi:hypothetical protein
MYALIGLSLVLVGIVGLQFTYVFFVERLYRERKKYLQALERKCNQLADRLEFAEQRLAEQNELLETIYPEIGKEDVTWADVIEGR